MKTEMKTFCRLGSIALFCLALALTGCPDPKQAVIVNQNSNDISSVDLETGGVTSDLGGLAIGPNANRVVIRGSTAYVVNSGDFGASANASVMVIDVASNTMVNTIPFPDGENPWAIAFVSDTRAYVTTLYGNNVTIINPTISGSSAILGTISLPVLDGIPAGPEGIVVSGQYAYTANTGVDVRAWPPVYGTASVSVIDTTTDTLVDVDGNPGNGEDTPIFTSQINAQDLDVDAQGQINVICTGDYATQFGVMDVIDPATWTVIDSVALGGSPGNISTGGNWALIGAGDGDGCDLYVVQTNTNNVVNDDADPLTLAVPSAWCTVGKIELGQTQDGLRGYAPAGVWGAEANLFEVGFTPSVSVTRTFDLAPADQPVAVGLIY